MRRAQAAFGTVDRAKEECRDANGVNLIEGLIQDLRYGLRVLRNNRGFTAVALLSLGLGIGANSTIFSIVDSQLLRPWPVTDPERLVAIQTSLQKDSGFDMSSYLDYRDIAGEIPAFSGVVAYGNRGGFISREGQGRQVSVEVVSPNYFTVLGVPAQRGRVFSGHPEQTAAEGRSVLLSDRLWKEYFGGDPALPGQTTLLDGKQFTVIGVAPRDFADSAVVRPRHLGHYGRLGHHGTGRRDRVTSPATTAGLKWPHGFLRRRPSRRPAHNFGLLHSVWRFHLQRRTKAWGSPDRRRGWPARPTCSSAPISLPWWAWCC